MKIKVTPEGRCGVWVADKDSVADYLQSYKAEQIHNFTLSRGVLSGCDWDKRSVISKVKEAERIAALTGEALRHNLRHALSVIVNNELIMFDIGELTEGNLLVV